MRIIVLFAFTLCASAQPMLGPGSVGAMGSQPVWFTNSFTNGFSQQWRTNASWSPASGSAVCSPTLEPDLIANGAFTAPVTQWTAGTNWTFSGGVANCVPGVSNNLTQLGGMKYGWMLGQFDVASASAGSLSLLVGTDLGPAYSSAGTYAETRRQVNNTQTIGVANDASFSGSADNVSFKRMVNTSLYTVAKTPSENMTVSVAITSMATNRQAGVLLRAIPTFNIYPIGDSKTEGGDNSGWPIQIHTPYTEHCLRSAVSGWKVENLYTNIVGELANRSEEPNYVLFDLGVNDYSQTDTNLMTTDWLFILDTIHTKWPNALIYLAHVWGRSKPCVEANQSIDQALASRPYWTLAGPDERIWVENGDNGNTYTSDGLHYNAAGDAKAGQLWAALLAATPVPRIGAFDGICVYYDGLSGSVKVDHVDNGGWTEVFNGVAAFVGGAVLKANVSSTTVTVTYNGSNLGTATCNSSTYNSIRTCGIWSTDSGNVFSQFSAAP